MKNPSITLEKIVFGLAMALSLCALALTLLAPGFGLDSGLVYGGF